MKLATRSVFKAVRFDLIDLNGYHDRHARMIASSKTLTGACWAYLSIAKKDRKKEKNIVISAVAEDGRYVYLQKHTWLSYLEKVK